MRDRARRAGDRRGRAGFAAHFAESDGPEMVCVAQPEPLGLGDALLRAAPALDGPFVIAPGRCTAGPRRAGMGRLAGHARAARDALLSGDRARFAQAVDASFDERAALVELDPRHVAMVRAARATGASATTQTLAGLSWVPCRQPASSPSRAHCARWAARSSRRVCRYD